MFSINAEEVITTISYYRLYFGMQENFIQKALEFLFIFLNIRTQNILSIRCHIMSSWIDRGQRKLSITSAIIIICSNLIDIQNAVRPLKNSNKLCYVKILSALILWLLKEKMYMKWSTNRNIKLVDKLAMPRTWIPSGSRRFWHWNIVTWSSGLNPRSKGIQPAFSGWQIVNVFFSPCQGNN